MSDVLSSRLPRVDLFLPLSSYYSTDWVLLTGLHIELLLHVPSHMFEQLALLTLAEELPVSANPLTRLARAISSRATSAVEWVVCVS